MMSWAGQHGFGQPSQQAPNVLLPPGPGMLQGGQGGQGGGGGYAQGGFGGGGGGPPGGYYPQGGMQGGMGKAGRLSTPPSCSRS